MNRPPFVVKLDQQSGCEWTPAEITRFKTWLREPAQSRLVWYAATRYLGVGVANEDIEEAHAAFFTNIFDAARVSYRPGGPEFCTYALHVCFKRECVRRGVKIRFHRQSTVSLHRAAVEAEASDDEIVDVRPQPECVVERCHLIDEISQILSGSDLPEQQRRAFKLRYFDEMTNEEAAWEMGAEVGTVRVWAHRAAAKIKEHLLQRGWGD